MTEKTTGLYRLVTVPAIYQFIQNSLGGYEECRDAFFSQIAGKRVLELGCGPGIWCRYLGNYEAYVGVDWNSQHIKSAQENYGSENTHFINGDVSTNLLIEQERFDFVLAIGLLHHLDDVNANEFTAARAVTHGHISVTLRDSDN